MPATYHGALRWTEHLQDATQGRIGAAEYVEVAENGLFHGLGDWVFSAALDGDETFGVAELQSYTERRPHVDLDLATIREMRQHALGYLARAVNDILSSNPDIVGFTTTFMQNVPSLACARLIKRRRPDVKILFGGGNCDGEMGVALHRNFRFVDFVVRGEGEAALPSLVSAVTAGTPLHGVPGLVWWDHGSQRVNAPGKLLAPTEIPSPNFDDWFEAFDASPVAEDVEPKLVLETARGCWWGEAHHCTFCGLNGTAMQFRSKAAPQAVGEITELVARHKVLDVIVVDNIIDNHYFDTVLPALADIDWDLRLHYEVKSNLSPDDVAVLKAGHVAHVQPGIESLVTPILKVMDKGVSGTRNVRVLRDLESAGLTVSWNWLYGFPEETADHYLEVIPQLRNLVHLQPPASAARILLERFSPYFADPKLGFAERQPAEAYRHVYRLPAEELMSLVYLFDTPHRGLRADVAAGLVNEVHWWRAHYLDSTLTCEGDDERIVIQDRRAGREPASTVIEGTVLVGAYRELEHGRSEPALRRRLLDSGLDVDDTVLSAWIARLLKDGLIFVESGQLIALATRSVPIKVATG